MSIPSRPKPQIPITPLEKKLDLFALLGIGLLFYITVTRFGSLPEIMPTHFGPSGEADAWGPRSTIITIPIAAVFLYMLFTVLGRFPQIYNYPVAITEENAERQYRLAQQLMYWIKAEMVWLMVYLQFSIIRAILSGENRINNVGMFLFLAVIIGTTVFCIVQLYRAK